MWERHRQYFVKDKIWPVTEDWKNAELHNIESMDYQCESLIFGSSTAANFEELKNKALCPLLDTTAVFLDDLECSV